MAVEAHTAGPRSSPAARPPSCSATARERATHVADVARACELAADEELTGVYNVGTEEATSFNEMVAMITDALGTDIDPEYIECPFDGYVHDTMADASKFREATVWEPEIDFLEGVERVCALPRG